MYYVVVKSQAVVEEILRRAKYSQINDIQRNCVYICC